MHADVVEDNQPVLACACDHVAFFFVDSGRDGALLGSTCEQRHVFSADQDDTFPVARHKHLPFLLVGQKWAMGWAFHIGESAGQPLFAWGSQLDHTDEASLTESKQVLVACDMDLVETGDTLHNCEFLEFLGVGSIINSESPAFANVEPVVLVQPNRADIDEDLGGQLHGKLLVERVDPNLGFSAVINEA